MKYEIQTPAKTLEAIMATMRHEHTMATYRDSYGYYGIEITHSNGTIERKTAMTCYIWASELAKEESQATDNKAGKKPREVKLYLLERSGNQYALLEKHRTH